LHVSPDSTPGTQFEISIDPPPASAISDPSGAAIPVAVAPPCVLTVANVPPVPSVAIALAIVAEPTASDLVQSLPPFLTDALEGATFFVEVWAQTDDPHGLQSVSLQVNFDSSLVTAIQLTPSALFDQFDGGTINNQLGRVENITGTHNLAVPPCSDQVGFAPDWARVAIIEMLANSSGNATILPFQATSPLLGTTICGQLGDVDPSSIDYSGAKLTIAPDGPTPPPPPSPDPSGIDKCRYISFVVPDGAAASAMTALRVRLDSLHHPSPPYANDVSIPFTAFEGAVRWVGPPMTFLESAGSQSTFAAARLQCDPHYQDWTAVGLLHVYGDAVVPSSAYSVEQVADGCQGEEETCSGVSPPLEVETTRWGDVAAAFGGGGQPNFLDASAIVDKFRVLPAAATKPRVQLQPDSPDPAIGVNFLDISACIDAFKGRGYPYDGPSACP
jgi:hypothetical protein